MKMKNKGIIIFGGTGDLAYRKLFPALYNLHCLGLLPEDYKIVGVGRKDYSKEDYVEIIKKWTSEFSRLKYRDEDFFEFSKRIIYYQMDMTKVAQYRDLLADLDYANGRTESGWTYYYAVPPKIFGFITDGIRLAGCPLSGAKVIIEKPFGDTMDAAEYIYKNLKQCFSQENIFFIDHYLGKEMIINIMTLRFANAIFGGVWNKDFIEKVEINAFEEVGVGTRGGYYDKSGAMVDMVQNHLFQILSIVAMERPADNSSEAIKAAQTKLFKELKDIEDPHKIDQLLVMGQYKGYLEEDKIDPESTTETYVALKLAIENDRWRGVPFYLRTGKKMAQKKSEVVITFKSTTEGAQPNKLIIEIQPDEGVKLDFNIKKPGTENTIEKVDMDFCQSCVLENRQNTPEAYERLLMAAMDEDRSLFSQWNQIEICWKYINRIMEIYHRFSDKVHVYEPGQDGPINNF